MSNVYVQQGDGTYIQVQTTAESEPGSEQTPAKPKGVVMAGPLGNEGTPILDQTKINKSEELKEETVKLEKENKGTCCCIKYHFLQNA